MYVAELKEKLDEMPGDLWVDVMFPDGAEVYAITGVERFQLSQGNERVIIDIVDDIPLKTV